MWEGHKCIYTWLCWTVWWQSTGAKIPDRKPPTARTRPNTSNGSGRAMPYNCARIPGACASPEEKQIAPPIKLGVGACVRM